MLDQDHVVPPRVDCFLGNGPIGPIDQLEFMSGGTLFERLEDAAMEADQRDARAVIGGGGGTRRRLADGTPTKDRDRKRRPNNNQVGARRDGSLHGRSVDRATGS